MRFTRRKTPELKSGVSFFIVVVFCSRALFLTVADYSYEERVAFTSLDVCRTQEDRTVHDWCLYDRCRSVVADHEQLFGNRGAEHFRSLGGEGRY